MPKTGRVSMRTCNFAFIPLAIIMPVYTKGKPRYLHGATPYLKVDNASVRTQAKGRHGTGLGIIQEGSAPALVVDMIPRAEAILVCECLLHVTAEVGSRDAALRKVSEHPVGICTRDHARRQQIPGITLVEVSGGVFAAERDAANIRLQPLCVDQHFQGLSLALSGSVWRTRST